MTSTLRGISIDGTVVSENARASILFRRDAASNATEESCPQVPRHQKSMDSTPWGMTIDLNEQRRNTSLLMCLRELPLSKDTTQMDFDHAKQRGPMISTVLGTKRKFTGTLLKLSN
jgi:hypothetical protein